MYDYENDEILDFFGGQDDIESKNIKHVDPKTFIEDPLRVYRAAQFAARFGFSIDPSTQKLARSMDLSDLPKERVFGEVQKMLLQSPKPSIGIQALDDMNVLDKHFLDYINHSLTRLKWELHYSTPNQKTPYFFNSITIDENERKEEYVFLFHIIIFIHLQNTYQHLLNYKVHLSKITLLILYHQY